MRNSYKVFRIISAWIIALSILVISKRGCAQSTAKEELIGKQCPRYTLTNVHHLLGPDGYEESVSLNDFEGRWLVLDFWTRSCGPCVKGFPELEKLQKEFDKKAKFILIGINDRYNKQSESYFEGVRTALELELPVAYDSMLWKQFKFYTVPHAVIVSPQGIIVKIIPTKEINSAMLISLFNEKK